MNQFTRREAVGDLLRPSSINPILTSNPRTFIRRAKLDSKGRIILPIDVRRNFGLEKDCEISVVFSLDKNYVLLVIGGDGQDGVEESIEGCGSSGPGANPGPDPYSTKEGGEDDG